MLNSVNLTGRATADPSYKIIGNDGVATFRLAVSYKDTVSFFDVECWGNTGKTVIQFVKKGHLLGISGRLKQDVWTTKKNAKRSSVKIVSYDVVFLTPKEKITGDVNKINIESNNTNQEYTDMTEQMNK